MLISLSSARSDKQHDNTKMLEVIEKPRQKGLIG